MESDILVFPCKVCKKTIVLNLDSYKAGNKVLLDSSEHDVSCIEPIPSWEELSLRVEEEENKFNATKKEKEDLRRARELEREEKRRNTKEIMNQEEHSRLEKNSLISSIYNENQELKRIEKEEKENEEKEKILEKENSIPLSELKILLQKKELLEKERQELEKKIFENSIPKERLLELILMKEGQK